MLRLGIIGYGNIGRFHVRSAMAHHGVTLVAIADPRPIDPATIPEGVAAYEDWKAMLERDDIDAVSICVPHYLHAPMASTILDAGKHVLVEKPLALTSIEGRELLDKAEKLDRVLMVELTHRYYPALREAKDFIESGQLGEIYALEDRVVEAVNGQILPWMKSKAQAGGGVALTNGVHLLDRVSYLTGQSLKFEHGRIGFKNGLGDVEDLASMFLALEDGTPVQILVAWPYGTSASDDELTIYGTNGTLRVWAWRGWRFEPVSGLDESMEKDSYPAGSDIYERVYIGVKNALNEFVAAVAAQTIPHSTAIGAIASQELIEQFYEYVGVESLVEQV